MLIFHLMADSRKQSAERDYDKVSLEFEVCRIKICLSSVKMGVVM